MDATHQNTSSSNPNENDFPSEDELGGEVGEMMRRLKESRRVRRSLEEDTDESESSNRTTRSSRLTNVTLLEAPASGQAHEQSRERIRKTRKMREEMEKRRLANAENPEEQGDIVLSVVDFVENEATGCRTAEEFMEMQRVLEISASVISGALDKVMSKYGRVRPDDVVNTFAEDPGAALNRAAEALADFEAHAGVMPAIAGRHILGPTTLDLGSGHRNAKPERARARRREKNDKPIVVPETDNSEENRVVDPTSTAVMAMHEQLKEKKKIPLFELVVDANGVFQQTALNSHVLSILLDRQWARLVVSPAGEASPRNSAQVYYVAAKAGAVSARAREVLAEDVAVGCTWITRWDELIMRLVMNASSDISDFAGMIQSDDEPDSPEVDDRAGPSGSSSAPVLQKTPRLS